MTKHSGVVLVIAVILGCLPAISFSQDRNIKDRAFGIVIYAEGGEAAIFRKGEYITFDLSLADIVGLPILEGDLIQTEKSSFIELQLYPTETVVKISENTTFTVEGLSTGGGATLDLTYGRVRSKVQKLAGRDPFYIKGRGTVAGVRGTDFGYDFIAEREGSEISAAVKIYCFEGEVEVRGPVKPSDSGAPEKVSDPVLLSANEMVRVRELPPEEGGTPERDGEPGPHIPRETVLVLEKMEIEEPVAVFWETNSFRAEPTRVEKIQEVFPGLAELLESETVQPEKFKRPEPLIRPETVPDRIAPPEPEETAPAPAAASAVDGAPPEKEEQKPVVVEADWQARLKEMRRTRIRVGSLGLFAIGVATFFVSMDREAGPASGIVFMAGGGLLSLVATGLFAGTFVE